jgi:uncharacterized protein YkwD
MTSHSLRKTITRRTILWTGLGTSVSLAGCASLFGPAPEPRVDQEAKMRAKRPYKPADPQAFAAIINAYRAENGLKPWAVDDRLTAIATTYARHLADAKQMTHELQPYGTLEKRLKDGGYSYLVAGENLGEGHSDIQDAFDGWHHSPPHDRGMRDPDATVFGIGSAYRPDDRYQAYWCLIFAKPRPARMPAPSQAGPFRWGPPL